MAPDGIHNSSHSSMHQTATEKMKESPNITQTLNQAHDEIDVSISRLSAFTDRVLGRPSADSVNPSGPTPPLPLNMVASSILGKAEEFRRIVNELVDAIG